MQNLSLPWLAYTLTSSPLLLGLVGTFQYLPSLILSLPAGYLVDHLPKRPLVVISQSTAALGASLLAIFLFMDILSYPILLALALLLGLAQCLDFPARQSWMLELVGKEDLTNAVALNSSAFNGARIIGPAIAGLVMAVAGIRYCFLLNALTFVPVLLVLLKLGREKPEHNSTEELPSEPWARNQTLERGVRLLGLEKVQNNKPEHGFSRQSFKEMFRSIGDALIYIKNNPLLLQIMISTAIMGIFALNYTILMPVKVKEFFGNQEQTYGYLISFMGLGSLAAAVFLALRGTKKPLARFMPVFACCVAVVLGFLGFVQSFWVSAVLMVLLGLFSVSFFTTATSSLQFYGASAYRGRLMSVYSLCFGGTSPIGNFIAGAISQYTGSTGGFFSNSLALIVGIASVFAVLRKPLKQSEAKGDTVSTEEFLD